MYIVAISLLFLIGMLVLVFDLGRTVAVRRDMVNAADAAALAAARECALGHGSAAAKATAVTLVRANATGGGFAAHEAATASLTPDLPDGPTWAPADGFWSEQCDALTSRGSKLVRVQGTVTLDYFFAGIFGFDSGSVTKAAVAQWGPAVGVSSPVPIYLEASNLAPCIADPSPEEPVACTFVFNNEPVSSQFGWLNFPQGWDFREGWNADRCTGEGGAEDIKEYIDPQPLPPSLAFDATIPTPPGYVLACGAPGEVASQMANQNDNNESAFVSRARSEDPFLTFPVTDFSRFPPVKLTGNRYAYPIVGFTRLKVLGALKGQDVLTDPECAAQIPPDQGGQGQGKGSGNEHTNASLFCVKLAWVGTQVGPGIPGTGIDYGLDAVRLVD